MASLPSPTPHRSPIAGSDHHADDDRSPARVRTDRHRARRSGMTLLAIAVLSQAARGQVIDVTVANPPYVVNPLVPDNPAFDNTPYLDAILNATPSGATLTFPTADYYFATPPMPPAAGTQSSIWSAVQFAVQGKTGVTLQGQGSGNARPRLIMRRRDKMGLGIRNCTGVTLERFILTYDQYPFTQGSIQFMGTEVVQTTANPPANVTVRYLDLQLATTPAAYPDPLTDPILLATPHALVAHDPITRRIKPGTDQYYVREDIANPVIAAGGFVRVRFTGSSWSGQNIAVGDLFTLKANNYQSMLRIEGNTDVTVRDVDIRMSCSSAVGDANNTNATYERVHVLPADSDALLSSNRDGMHIQHPRNGPTVRDCMFERTGDDGIAVRSNWIQVSDVTTLPGNVVEIDLRCVSKPTLLLGDTLEFFRSPDFTTVVSAPLTMVGTWGPQATDKTYPITVQVTGPLPPVLVDDYVMDREVHGQGFLLAGNTIRDHRARGIFIKTSGGTVEDNVIERSTMAGILVGPQIEPGSWQESGFVRDVVIRRNQIRQLLSATTDSRHSAALAVMVQVPGMVNGVNTIALQHRHLTLADNVIELSGRTGILLMNVDDAEVTGNRIFDGYWNPYASTPSIKGLDGVPVEMVNLQGCTGVKVHHNKIETVPGHDEFHMAANCTDCSFTDNVRVIGTGFEQIGVPGFPSTVTISYYNNSTPQWTRTEDGLTYTMRQWGLFGNHAQYPYYLDLQTSRCAYDNGTLEVAIADATGVDFMLGSNFLTSTWKCAVELEPSGGSAAQIGSYLNSGTDLDATTPKPYFTRKQLQFTASGPHVLRFRRDSPGSTSSPYVYLDDVLVEFGNWPDQ